MTQKTIDKYAKMGLTREKLVELFCTETLSCPQIAKLYNLTDTVVFALIKSLNIQRSEEDTARYKARLAQEQSARQSDPEFQARKRAASIERCGYESWHATPEGRAKLSAVQKLDSTKKQIEQTCLERYGNTSYSGSSSYYANLSASQEKAKKTTQSRYGAEYWTQSTAGKVFLKQHEAKHKEKVDQTCLDRYGTTNPNELQHIKDKIAATKTERYGAVYVEEFNNKIKATKFERYGTETYNNMPQMKATKLERYGDENYTNTALFHQHFLERRIPEKFRAYYDDKELSQQLLIDNKFTYTALADYFEVTLPTIYAWAARHDLQSLVVPVKSRYEAELRELLTPLGFTKMNDRTAIDKQHEIDLYNPELKIGVEFNGDYWHSDQCKPPLYHQQKSLLAAEKGIRLIHIYEYEWNDPRIQPILLSMIRIACKQPTTKIYARQCVVKQITNKEAKPFNDKNHLQRHRNAQVTYGLFYEGELVQLMSFSKHQKYEWEIIRGCPGSNNIVIGGVSKLFKHFVREHQPKFIFSYCDFNKFDGSGYEALGMRCLGLTTPDKTWLIDGRGVKRNPYRAKEYAEKATAIIWGAGSKRYLWQNS